MIVYGFLMLGIVCCIGFLLRSTRDSPKNFGTKNTYKAPEIQPQTKTAAAAAAAIAPVDNNAAISLAAEVAEKNQKIKQIILDHAKLAAIGNLEDTPTTNPEQSRVGGPVWLPEDMAYPADKDGRPLLFMVQVNFQEIQPLQGYPTSGLLQLFIGTDDMFGADFDDLRNGSYASLYHPDPSTLKTRYEALSRRHKVDEEEIYNPIMSKTLSDEGRRLFFDDDLHNHSPSPFIWPINIKALSGFDLHTDSTYDMFDEIHQSTPPNAIKVGGHPEFTQDDPRLYRDKHLRRYDTVLMQIGYSEYICIGDAGEMSLLINSEDLANRDFSKTLYTWDCS